MSRRMLNDQILVKPIPKQEKQTASGIIIPEQISKRRGVMEKGTVIQSGNENVKEGETVYFRPNSGLEIELEDQSYLILHVKEVGLAESPAA